MVGDLGGSKIDAFGRFDSTSAAFEPLRRETNVGEEIGSNGQAIYGSDLLCR